MHNVMKKILVNGKIILPERILDPGYVYIEGNIILEVGEGVPSIGADTERIDVDGKYVSPGFIDIHVHGGGGADFMDGTVDAFLTVAETHVKYGTTALYPTTLTSEVSLLFETLDAYAEAAKCNNKGAQLMGMHLEGPYFAMSQRGRKIRNIYVIPIQMSMFESLIILLLSRDGVRRPNCQEPSILVVM